MVHCSVSDPLRIVGILPDTQKRQKTGRLTPTDTDTCQACLCQAYGLDIAKETA